MRLTLNKKSSEECVAPNVAAFNSPKNATYTFDLLCRKDVAKLKEMYDLLLRNIAEEASE